MAGGYKQSYYTYGSEPSVYNWHGKAMQPSRANGSGLGGAAEVLNMSLALARPAGAVAGIVYASKNKKSKLLYGLAGWLVGGVVDVMVKAAKK